MTNLISKITKLAMIPILAGSLNGCYQKYNIDGEIVKYNKDLISPLKIITKDSVFLYSVLNENKDSVESVSVFPCFNGKCQINKLQTYSLHGKDKEKILNAYQKRFTNDIKKIN